MASVQSNQIIRDRISSFFTSAYSGALPLEWENMPPPQRLTEGWLRLSVVIDRFEIIGLSPGRQHYRGRIIMLIAVAKGQGTARMDKVATEIVSLLAKKQISGIRTGAAVFATPRRETGLHVLPLEIRFTAFEADLNTGVNS